MNDEQVIEILHKFSEYLHTAGIFYDPFRIIAWIFVSGIAWFLDALENVANEMLLVKEFFQNESVVEFVNSFRPLFYVLLAFSLLYTGYLLIFQRKLQAETVAINFVIALAIVTLLSSGMDRVNGFTDEAVQTVNSGALFGSEEGTVSENILAENISDLYQFDQTDWADVEQENSIPVDMVSKLKITERFDAEELELKNEDVAKKYLSWNGEEAEPKDFDQGGLADWNNEYYYRYSLDWFTIIMTMLVMAFTLFSIAYKLSRLAFELVFNHILVMIVAPADLHDGQKTKKIIQSILNTFLVIVLIFMSMKLYIIGTAYLADSFDGLVYLIALIGFSVALLDGPNIVERLFGIDAGLKGGWSLLAGTYAAGKMATNFANGVGKLTSKDNGNDKGNGKGDSEGSSSDNGDVKNQNQSPLQNAEAKSPFDEKGKGKGKESPLKPSLDGSDKGESEQIDKSDIEANGDEKGKASVSKSGETKGDSANSDLEGAIGGNGGSQSLETTSEREQEVKQNQDIQQKSTGGQATLKGTGALDGATPDLEQQMNGDNANQGNGISISRQGLTEQPVNITDMQNGTQTATTSSQGGSIQQATAPDQSLEQQAQPNKTEGSTVQIGQNDVQRQSNIEQPVNITDVQNGTQTVTTSGQSTTSGQGGSESTGSMPSSTGTPKVFNQERVVSESSTSASTSQTTVQQENVNQVNEEVKVEENNRTVTGSQSVHRVENAESGGGAAVAVAPAGFPKISSEEKVVESEGQDRQHVINRKSKKDRFNRMKNQTKK
ncbi:pLS20_p028 family conjugation system transmembrane protein [Domibacillus iocasae]|uniref:DUF8208 domain-containing protein n=1 Tax=Domibacillus iocasae TaxID=1714016 RepID=A0A1E7DL03_9BACI|nr:hypothetical protein [Domibacillus iocasae]OES43368.1 hypothetical protein BA724_14055 [Domibacillus iocasae]